MKKSRGLWTRMGTIFGVILAECGVLAHAAEAPQLPPRPVVHTAGAPQVPPGPVAAHTAEAPEMPPGLVALNFPENVELKVLIDYVGKRQGISFLYDEAVGNTRVTIKAPRGVPAESLMALFDNVLKMKNLTMTPTGVAGMMRIEAGKPLTVTSMGPKASEEALRRAQLARAMTRVFELRYVRPQRIEEVIKPFLSATTAALTSVPEHNLIIVTDYAENMKRIEELLAVFDRPGREVVIRFVPVVRVEASALSQQVTQLLAAKRQARGETAKEAPAGAAVLADDRTNQVAVVGTEGEVEEIVALVQTLDIPLGTKTKIYTFVLATAKQVDEIVKELIGEVAAKRLYKAAVDSEANLLVVTATPEIHQQIEALRETLDKQMEESQYPIRFYKLENAKAADVLATLRNIESGTGMEGVSVDGLSAEPSAPPGLVIQGPKEKEVNSPWAGGKEPGKKPERSDGTVELQDALVMADEATNTIIVIATPAVHPIYEKLIQRLDVRRPQVLIDATVVMVDTTDGFSLGVEISNTEDFHHEGEDTYLTFSAFGLSDVDVPTGRLAIRPGVGFNGTVVSADIANVVVRALESDSRAKVVARPSVLIDDNATGVLISESEEPYASVNASTTVATTSFGGYSAAGTNITLTPHISQGDHLKLDYEIKLSSFNADRTDALPPSRQTNSLKSQATIPDGHTIIVGGLTRENFEESVDRVPLLGRIPGLEYLFSRRSKDVSQMTLFVFIRPTILRDDQFEDLKILSRDEAREAELADDFPSSEPVDVL